MSNVNVLKLQLDIINNQLSSVNGLVEEIEWTADQDKYTVQLQVPKENKFDNIAFIIKDSNDNFKEFFELIDQKDGIWQGTSSLLKEVRGGTKIKAGVRYTLNENKFYTSPIEVSIKKSIDNTNKTEIENLPPDFNSILTILTKFDNAKAIDNIKTAKLSEFKSPYDVPDGIVIPENDDPYCLFIQYKGDTKYTYTGIISLTPIELGLIEDYTGGEGEEGTGGGGKVGYGAYLGGFYETGGKRGFAGGRDAIATDGAAVGYKSEAEEGFSGGMKAKSHNKSIAIGTEASVDNNSKNGIAIGAETLINNSENAVIIGTRNQVYSSPHSVIIGSSAKTKDDGQDGSIENILDNSKETIVIGNGIRPSKSNQSILIGEEVYSICPAYGTEENKDSENRDIWGAIGLGRYAIAAERSCIAIGPNTVSGCYKDEDGYINSSYEQYTSVNEPAAIAIGRGCKAVGHASVALGKHALATRFNGIAIGNEAEAGPNIKEYSRLSTYDDDGENNDGNAAIAIGWQAKAKAAGAIQLGRGINTTVDSLQFRNTTIVKDGLVQFDLGKTGAQGILPVTKGGTGAATKRGARQCLGIYTGNKTWSLPLSDFSNNTGKDIAINYAAYKFKSPPKLWLNLRFSSTEQTSPVLFNYYIKEITTEKVTIRVDYWSQDWDASKKNNKLTFAFDVLAIGDGIKIYD